MLANRMLTSRTLWLLWVVVVCLEGMGNFLDYSGCSPILYWYGRLMVCYRAVVIVMKLRQPNILKDRVKLVKCC